MKKRTNLKIEDLYSNCLLASIANAIYASQFPLLSYEHSWDGINYSVQNSEGIRGTISFLDQYCIAAFRDDKSKRLHKLSKFIPAIKFFKGAPEKVKEAAEKETLQYLLENVDNDSIPLITTSFWCIGNYLYSNDSLKEIKINGMSVLEFQLLESSDSIEKWIEYYEMSKDQINLLKILHNKKILNPNQIIILSNEERKLLGRNISEEAIESFKEIGMIFE